MTISRLLGFMRLASNEWKALPASVRCIPLRKQQQPSPTSTRTFWYWTSIFRIMDGLSLLRELAAKGEAPDTIFITAARDVASVRSAMSLGAVYYLVKPFGFPQLQERLRAYRAWRRELASGVSTPADQQRVDSLFNLLRPRITAENADAALPTTMTKVLETIRNAARPIGASEVAAALGMSRPTAQRYLSDLERRSRIRLELSYGATGRPVHRYCIRES